MTTGAIATCTRCHTTYPVGRFRDHLQTATHKAATATPPTDVLYPAGDRPPCVRGDGRPVYMAGLCSECYGGGLAVPDDDGGQTT